MSVELDFEFTGKETPEELDAMLDSLEDLELADEPGTSDASTGSEPELKSEEPDSTPDVDTGAASAAAGEETGTQGEDDTKPEGVATKDNQHIIPFEVLERERDEKRQLNEELEKLKSERGEWEQGQRLLELRNKQLEKLGINPEDLPENLDITDEQLDSLTDDYPEVGKVIKHLVAKVKSFETTSPPTEPSQEQSPAESNPVAEAIKGNADLNAWRTEGGDKWSKALDIDDELRADPHWQDKPLADRFTEVSRRVNAAFEKPAASANSQEVRAKAEAAEEQANADLPASPSEVGATSAHQGTVMDKVANADADEVGAMFDNMSDDQIEALLSTL